MNCRRQGDGLHQAANPGIIYSMLDAVASQSSKAVSAAATADVHAVQPPTVKMLRGTRRQRMPVVPVTASFCVGIALDRFVDVPLSLWMSATALGLLGWLVAANRNHWRIAAWLVLTVCVCTGGSRHHLHWSIVPADDIRLFAQQRPKPVLLTGWIESQPTILRKRSDEYSGAYPRFDRTLCTVRCDSLFSGEESLPVSGCVRLEVHGHLLHVDDGDKVRIAAVLSQPVKPRNPGAFDFNTYLKRRGIGAVLRTKYPDSVCNVQSTDNGWRRRWGTWNRLREQCAQIMRSYLSPRNAPIGIALLLGDRTEVSQDIRNAFAESGTIHFLALSGLHVGILVSFVWVSCRLLRCSWPVTAMVIVSVSLGYALLTDGRPSVVRATVMTIVAFAGAPWYRKTLTPQALAISALLLLIWNPAHLFEVGPQLSFLAVMAIIWVTGGDVTHASNVDADPADLKLPPKSPLRRFRNSLLRRSWLAYRVSAAIWLFTIPLTVARFNLVSPVGLAINVLLLPVVAFVLWLGFGLLFCSLLLPPLVPAFAAGFDLGLSLFTSIVDYASQIQLGHFYLPGPGDWWLAVFYAILGLLAVNRAESMRWWAGRSLLCWICVGLVTSLWPSSVERLRCTFLSVGHGCAIVLEMPHGTCLLYDAGQLHDSTRAERIVANALWQRGISRLDAVILSHADIDHFNALPGLLEKMQVKRVLLSPSFLDFSQPAVVALCDAVAHRDVSINLVGTGDRLLIDQDVEVRILHPPAGTRRNNDNANSIVMAVQYAGRRILLTGDLEDEGLDALLSTESLASDIVLAPHHGSLRANTREFAAWSQPKWLVVSGGNRESRGRLSEVYGSSTKILSTGQSGAVTFTIDADGWIECKPFVKKHNSIDREPAE